MGRGTGGEIMFAGFFFFQAEDGIRDLTVTGVQTCALPISILLLLIGAPFNSNFTIRISFGLFVFTETVSHTFTWIILSHPRIDMFHVKSDCFSQTRDFLLQGTDGGMQQILKHPMIEAVLLLAKPAIRRHRTLHMKPVWLVPCQLWPEADLEHQERMFYQEATQSRAGLQAFGHFDDEGFDIGTLGMRTLTWTRGIHRRFGHHAPIKLVKKRTIALHERIMREHQGHGPLVKEARFWYHYHGKLLADGNAETTLFQSA